MPTTENPTPDEPRDAADPGAPDALVGAPGAPDEARRDEASDTDAAPARRRGFLVPVALGVGGLVLVGGVVTAVVLGGREPVPDPTTPPAVTVTNPLPTPVASPAERETGTDLLAALPDAVLQWVVASQEPVDSVPHALEAYRLTYTDGTDGTVTLDVAQLATVDEAVATAGATADGDPAPTEEDVLREQPVLVGDREVGTATMRLGADEGLVTWTNGTTALRVAGPAAAVENFFLAFPL